MASEAEVDLIINATRALPELERDLDRIITIAENGAPDVDVQAALDLTQSVDRLNRDLDRAVTAAAAGADDIDLDAVLNQQNTLRRLRSDLNRVTQAATSGNAVDPLTLQGVLDGPETLRTVRSELQRVVAVAQATTPDITIDVEVDDASLRQAEDSTNRLARSALGAVGAVGGFGTTLGTAGAAAGTAAPLIASVVTAVEQLLPAAALATTGMLAIQSASGAVKLAMIGVSDAIEAAFDPEAKPEDLAKALEKLAPEARKFVTELNSMRGALKDIQQEVQNRFFDGFSGKLKELSTSVLPNVRKSLNSSADSLNNMAIGAANAAIKLSKDGTLGIALKGANQGLRNLEKTPGLVVTAFGQLAAAAAPAFDRVTEAVARVADEVSKKLTKAFESGALEKAIDGAVDAIAQLGRIAGNVFTIVGNVMSAAGEQGDGLFGTLEKITGALALATSSEGFQRAIGALTDTMGTLATNIAPLLIKALAILGPVIEELAPPVQHLIDVLGGSLGEVLDALGPVLVTLAESFGKMLPVLEPFIELAGELLADILPSLNPLFETLGNIFEEMAPFAQQVADNLGVQLTPVLEKLPGILEEVLPFFTELAERLFPLLTDTLDELGPSLSDLATALGELLVELTPLIVKWLELQIMFVDRILPIIEDVISFLVRLVNFGLQLLTRFLDRYVIPGLKTTAALLSGDFSGAVEYAKVILVNFVEDAGRALVSLRQKAADAVLRMASDIIGNARRMAQGFIDATVRMINEAVRRIRGLPGQIRSALPGAGQILIGIGQAIIRGLITGINSMIPSLINTLGSITSRLPDWKGPEDLDRRILIPAGRSIMDGFMKGIADSVPALERQLGGITLAVPAMVTPGAADFGFRGVLTPQAPTVYVSIGNEAVDRYVTTRVDSSLRTRDRELAQGVRR
ncbi:phage tail protein [Streptomyces hebeiensis]